MIEQNKTFTEVFNNYYEKLELFSKAITRAHGKNHPEAFEVRELFEAISKKVKEDVTKIDLENEFTQLRKITDNYTIPNNVCETYAATFHMLEELDKVYQA
ncbi:hypothetical protein [Bacillus kwashiorkori]|uniref:hypothetical protein n=1 Tax=Bacillus kwashiorkori TaxID=1522318 RepID=UPI000780BF9E|nr:hypothetical protein [Bacillus kwashiorkori]